VGRHPNRLRWELGRWRLEDFPKKGNFLKIRLSLAVLVLALAPVAAPLVAAGHPLVAVLIRSFFSGLCHQDPTRSFLVDGSPVAVCVRCLGIYCGAALVMVLPARRASAMKLLATGLVLNLVDVGTELLHWHGNLPMARFVLGLLLGAGAAAVLLWPRDGFAGATPGRGPIPPGRPLGLR